MNFTEYLDTKKELSKVLEQTHLEELDEDMSAIVYDLDESDAKMAKDKGGFTAAEMLADFFNEFGDQTWETKDAKNLKKRYGARIAGQLQINLIRWGYISKDADAVFSITNKGFTYLKNNTDIPTGTSTSDEDDKDVDTAKGVRDVTKLKAKRFKVPKPGANSKYLDQMSTILSHMKSFARGATKTTFMLAGDPGTGKTSFVKSLSDLTGIPLVIIEAPHITQEHIINIPFLVIDGMKEHKGNVSVDTSNENSMKVVQAESNLVTILKSKKRRTPQQVQSLINRSKPLRDIQPKLSKRIGKVSEQYNSILFLDEFYRTSSIKIRNVLRNILNGKIGNDKIPAGVYIIMATNINDDGVEDIPLNQDFHVMDYDVSSKEDFMNYMYGKYVDNPDDYDDESEYDAENPATPSGIAIKEEVWNEFMTGLEDADLGKNDEDADVRFSPRRLEQLILYINAALPVHTIEEAKSLLSFVKNNFSNYLTGQSMDDLKDNIMLVTKRLMTETSDWLTAEQVDSLGPHDVVEWKSVLRHELEMKMTIGDARTYIPVVSGLPGIGKTTVFEDIAKEKNMGFIQIDVSNLTPEDIIGMPIADTSNGNENITTSFSEANLYITIMKEYNAIIDRFKQDGRKYNVILLFDELNRTEVPVFNAIRQVLLEKKFSDDVKLPDDVLITGAINPVDIGAIEFTSHTRDVLDIIPSAQSFRKLFDYIPRKAQLVAISNDMGFDVAQAVSNCMSSLAEEFKSPEDADGNILGYEEQPFWWDIGGAIFYVSGREMTEACALAVSQIEDEFDDMGWSSEESYTEKQQDKFIKAAVTIVANSFNATFKMVALKQDIQEFSKTMALKITGNSKYSSFFNGIKSAKGAGEISLDQILTNAEDDIQYLDKGVVGAYINYTQPSEFTNDFTNICRRFMTETHASHETLNKIIDLTLRLNKSLTSNENIKHDFNANLMYQAKAIIKEFLKEPEFDLVGLMKDDKALRKIEKLNTAFQG